MTDQSVLQEAEQLVNGPRQADYGTPFDSMSRIAKLWEPILSVDVSAEQVALCLAAMKLARLAEQAEHGEELKRDSVVDLAGYAAVLEQVLATRSTTPGPLDHAEFLAAKASGTEIEIFGLTTKPGRPVGAVMGRLKDLDDLVNERIKINGDETGHVTVELQT